MDYPNNIERSDFNEEDFWDDGEPALDDTCPYCGTEYDDIDYEYQICHRCGHDNN